MSEVHSYVPSDIKTHSPSIVSPVKTSLAVPAIAAIVSAEVKCFNTLALFTLATADIFSFIEPTEVTLKDGRKHNGSLLYTIRPIQEAVEYDYEQRLKRFQAEQYRQKALERWEKRYGNQGSKIKQEKESAL